MQPGTSGAMRKCTLPVIVFTGDGNIFFYDHAPISAK
jgi:hypothetical protein